MFFFGVSVFLMLSALVFDRFHRQATDRCYFCVFRFVCCFAFDAMCMVFLIGFADGPPLVAICVFFVGFLSF